MSNKFNKNELLGMNSQYPWNGSIKIHNTKYNDLNNEKYILHATGDCNIMTGRIYIALKADTKINEEVRKKYNLM